MPFFTKKPITIEAVQFHPDQKPWPAGVYSCPSTSVDLDGATTVTTAYVVSERDATAEDDLAAIRGGFARIPQHDVLPGDWIATGTHGERYPIRPEIFATIYEPAGSQKDKLAAIAAAGLEAAALARNAPDHFAALVEQLERLGPNYSVSIGVETDVADGERFLAACLYTGDEGDEDGIGVVAGVSSARGDHDALGRLLVAMLAKHHTI